MFVWSVEEITSLNCPPQHNNKFNLPICNCSSYFNFSRPVQHCSPSSNGTRKCFGVLACTPTCALFSPVTRTCCVPDGSCRNSSWTQILNVLLRNLLMLSLDTFPSPLLQQARVNSIQL